MQSPSDGPPPVFVDHSGRRRRLSVLAGTGLAVGLLASLGLILAGLMTGSSVSVPGWPEDSDIEQPFDVGVDELDISPSSTSKAPVPRAEATPSVSPATTSAAPTPRASAQPQVTVVTRPTTSPTQDDPGRGTTKPNKSPGKPN